LSCPDFSGHFVGFNGVIMYSLIFAKSGRLAGDFLGCKWCGFYAKVAETVRFGGCVI